MSAARHRPGRPRANRELNRAGHGPAPLLFRSRCGLAFGLGIGFGLGLRLALTFRFRLRLSVCLILGLTFRASVRRGLCSGLGTVSVVGGVPSGPFQLKSRSRNQFFQFATAVFMHGQRLVGKSLQRFDRLSTAMARVFVKRHLAAIIAKLRRTGLCCPTLPALSRFCGLAWREA